MAAAQFGVEYLRWSDLGDAAGSLYPPEAVGEPLTIAEVAAELKAYDAPGGGPATPDNGSGTRFQSSAGITKCT
jgi:hypothetical protein